MRHVIQKPEALFTLKYKGTEKNSQEKETVKLSCSCSTSSEYVRLYWYRQYPNRKPQFLLYKNERTDYEYTSDDRFHSATTRTSTELTITDVRLSDSALYYLDVIGK
uniref:Ig-like domain-containing protein n=1 Tax=Cyprinus carpio TaxID=7962 RepID=A0A8C2GAP9_CYPCA